MQNNKTEKIIVDKLKLVTLQRLGCSEKAIIDKILYGNFTSQNDELIDTLLSSLTDEKSFSNWGGSRENSGRKPKKINNINQDEKIKLIKSSCFNQVVDKDKDIYLNNNLNLNNNNNKKIKIVEGEFYLDNCMPEYKDVTDGMSDDQCYRAWKWIYDKFLGQELSVDFIKSIIKKFGNMEMKNV